MQLYLNNAAHRTLQQTGLLAAFCSCLPCLRFHRRYLKIRAKFKEQQDELCLKNKNTRHAHLKSRILVTPSVFCFLTCVTLVISTLKLAHCGDKSQQQETSYMTIKIWKEFRALQSKRSLHTAVCFRWKPSWARTVASEHSHFNISTSYERF